MSAGELIGTVLAFVILFAVLELGTRGHLNFLLLPEPEERERLSSPDDHTIDFDEALVPIGGFDKWGYENERHVS